MKHLKRILIIDDQIESFESIIQQLELAGKTQDEVNLIWVPMVMTAATLVGLKCYPIDHVYCDVPS